MRNKFTRQAQSVLTLAKRAAVDFELGYIGTEHLLLGFLSEREGTAGRVLEEFQVDGKKLVELIDKLVTPTDTGNVEILEKQPVYSPRTKSVLEGAVAEAQSTGCAKAGTEHLLLAMLRETDCVGTRLLYTMGVNIQKLYAAVLSAMGYDNESIQEEFQAARTMQSQKASITPALDQYSRDLTRMAAEGRLDPVVGRDREITRLIQILSRRTKNNPCLVGEPGVGKTAIAEGLAQRIIAGTVPDTIRDKRLVVLDLSGMVAGSKYRGEFEERIRKVVDEVRENQGILLFIDELHTIIGAGGAEGALDASNILKPSLSRGELQIIGATTLEEYRKYIEKDAALERRFQPITVEEPSEEEAYEILKGLRPYYERHHKVEIQDEALKAAVKMSVRYINDRFLPDKAIDLIDEAASKVQLSEYQASTDIDELSKEIQELLKEKENAIKSGRLDFAKEWQQKQKEAEAKLDLLHAKEQKKNRKKTGKVDEKAVASIVSDWTRIPVQKLTEGESRRLARLEKELHKRVIGQEEAVHAVSQAVKRGRVGLKDPNRPIGSFLFLGPTGVGKTELSKALAEAVFGSEQAMIRVDMSEYMEKHSVSKLIGSPPGYVGYDEGGQLSEKVRRNPYSVILFDEIEKAHPDVFNILLQVLDEGRLTDNYGRTIDFKNTVIIMTSNIGTRQLKEFGRGVGFAAQARTDDNEYSRSVIQKALNKTFAPEFLNRLDEIITFDQLSLDAITKIVDIELKGLYERIEAIGYKMVVDDEAKRFLAAKGYDVQFGARPLKRAIQNYLEDGLSELIVSAGLQPGDTVNVSVDKEKDELSITKA